MTSLICRGRSLSIAVKAVRGSATAWIVLLGLLGASPAQGIVNGHPPARDDWRFDAVGAFATSWRLGQDPTHPNAQDHDWYCAATLTSSNVVVLAKHCVDSYGTGEKYAVRFRRHLDGTLGTIEAGPGSFFHAFVDRWIFPASGDVALGILAEPVSHIRPIPLLLDGTATLAHGTPFIHAGWGKEGPGPGEGPRRQLLLCDNRLTQAQPTYLSFYNAWDPAGPGCGVNNNDSGSPVLLESPHGELRNIGIVASYGYATHVLQYTTQRPFARLARRFHGDDLVPVKLAFEARPCVPPGGRLTFAGVLDNVGMRLSVQPFRATMTLEPVSGTSRAVLLAKDEFSTWGLPADWTDTVLVPETTPHGDYRLALTVDSAASVTESIEANNRLAATTLVRVWPRSFPQCGSLR
jgi:hypothetical protein